MVQKPYGYKRGLVDGFTFWPFPIMPSPRMWAVRRNPEWTRGHMHGLFAALALLVALMVWGLS